MKINRYNIPKLPRSKYNVVGSYSSKYSSSGNIINNYNADLYDGLDSTSTEKGLTANLGKVLNDKIERDYLKKTDALNRYLSKLDDDISNGKITFKKGLVTDDITSSNFNFDKAADGFKLISLPSGDSRLFIRYLHTAYIAYLCNVEFENMIMSKGAVYGESGFTLVNEDGKYKAELDNLTVRGKLDVKTLQIEESKYIGGKIYCTEAGFKISKVVEGENYYRCEFINTQDGITIHNKFRVNDLAFCQTFNNNKVKRYWRKVVASGTNFINLSKSDCEYGSDVPEVGDDVVLLGNSRTKSRLGALIISPEKLEVVEGINTYILPEPKITLAPSNTKIDADTINFLGKTIINNNFQVDTLGNLAINGKITTNSGKIGNFTINDRGLYNDASQGIAEIEITDSGEVNEVGFTLGKQGTPYLCDIYHRENGALRCTSEIGTAINAYSRGGFGLVASKTSVEGLHISPMVIGSNENNVTLSVYSDFVIFNSNQALTVHFPNPKEAKGKIFILKNIGNTVTLYGSVVPKLEVSPNTQYDLRTASPVNFICDGNKWYEL